MWYDLRVNTVEIMDRFGLFYIVQNIEHFHRGNTVDRFLNYDEKEKYVIK